MTVLDVADFLNADEKTVYRLMQKGNYLASKSLVPKVAGTWRFNREGSF
jgi:hypothetical protein